VAHRAVFVALVAIAAGGCATEQRTVVMASDDACTRYGFTAATVDYIRCQQQVAAARRTTVVVSAMSSAELIAQSQMACDGYGVPRGAAAYDRCVQDEFAARRPG
jgi:hypothetical protein